MTAFTDKPAVFALYSVAFTLGIIGFRCQLTESAARTVDLEAYSVVLVMEAVIFGEKRADVEANAQASGRHRSFLGV